MQRSNFARQGCTWRLCPPCAALNWEKRHQSVDLAGKVVVLTGGRIKIGYHVALKVLRAGCAELVVTTRFPRDAVSTAVGSPVNKNPLAG